MSNSDLVRYSRDGDQFHYLWAARRCLPLLSHASGLVAVSIEGASTSECVREPATEVGEELIDIAEYYGSENFERAESIKYYQLKHSTQHSSEPWTASGLEKTLNGFAKRYGELCQKFSTKQCQQKLHFYFVSNRPISSDILETVAEVAAGADVSHPIELVKLKNHTSLTGDELSCFCRLLHLDGQHEGYWDQRKILIQEVSGYLPGADVDAPVQLKELVNLKALSESSSNPTITKTDLLRAFGTDETYLFPAPSRIIDTDNVVPREIEETLIANIVGGKSSSVIIHADGGVGKSVFATRIRYGLPIGSVCLLYDCFGNGQYRNTSAYRHRHKDALVQIANDLSSMGLCHPLIPKPYADSTAYLKAFKHRINQSISSIRELHPEALLCIVIDAADNAQMMANELGESRSFARDLLREDVPDGVRLIVTTRTHRLKLLDPPYGALQLELCPFSRSETANLLRLTFPDATEQDVDEFHRLSSQNPRVQANALSIKVSLHEILRALGPNPTTVDDTISNLLDRAISELRDRVGKTEGEQINLICAGLASLRPLIPINVLASVSGVEDATVKSFAYDLGRPLMVAGETIQFYDEPAETWFREHFKPEAAELAKFIEILRPLASKSAYVAATLPQLMMEAGQFSELLELALSTDALPEGSPLEKRDIELQRLQFALKASLRAKHYSDSAKLALKAGGETAAESRQHILIQENTDLAAVFMDSSLIQELVSRRAFGGGWMGSHHAYEAGLLSAFPELRGEARSRLRMAHEWIRNWSSLNKRDREKERIEDNEIAEIVMTELNIQGAQSAVKYLRRWSPREVSYRVGRIVAEKLVDLERYSDLDEVALAAGNDIGFVLAVTTELRNVHRYPPVPVIERALKLLGKLGVKLLQGEPFDHKEKLLGVVTSLVEAACQLSQFDTNELADLLHCFLPTNPPRGLSSRFSGSRFSLLRAYSLKAALNGVALELNDLAHPDFRKELETQNSHSSQDAREFEEAIGALLPWHQLWVSVFLRNVPEDKLSAAIADACAVSSKADSINYREESYTADEIALLWLDILVMAGGPQDTRLEEFDTWVSNLKRSLFTKTFNSIARITARHKPMQSKSFGYAHQSFELIKNEREDASSKVISYVEIARAILAVSESEAKAYFDQAVEVASNIGEENLDRWSSILYLADRAANPQKPLSEIAYRLSRCAELTYEYVVRDKYFDWEATVRAITALCPSSGLTILSRWRDRKFGWAERLLPEALKFLVDERGLDPLTPMALFGFRAQWDNLGLLSSALGTSKTQTQKIKVTNYLYRYMRLDDYSVSTWQKLRAVATSHGVNLIAIDDLIAYCERKERSKQSDDHSSVNYDSDRASVRGAERDWDAVFAQADLTNPNGITDAYHLFKSSEPPYYHDRFFVEACKRVMVGKEDGFIRSLLEVTEFELYHFRNFLEQVPASWRQRQGIKTAIQNTLKLFCRRYCMEINRSRYYEIFPFELASKVSGLSESDIADIVVEAIAGTAEELSSGQLFTLTGILALRIDQAEALGVLRFGLDLFDDFLKENDGDGVWSDDLIPPADINGAIAGYVWAGLAAPSSSLRWQAAHVVRGLCFLERSDILRDLIKLAESGKAGPFADHTLHFYNLHALQWLLIALARAAMESPDSVIPYTDFLVKIAFEGSPHVLIRNFATKSVHALIKTGRWIVNEDTCKKLLFVNTSSFPVQFTKSFERVNERRMNGHESSRDWEYYFGLDIGPYWFSRLGDLFALSEAEISKDVAYVIESEWGFGSRKIWRNDQRLIKKFYSYDDTRHSHGDIPRTDDLQFYLAYHGMMTVAGKLLLTHPLYQNPDYPEDDFQDWLGGHNLTRKDGRWLTDRRDPQPLEWPDWKDEKDIDEWSCSVQIVDFDRVLGIGHDRLNLWGYWTTKTEKQEESVRISSAFVTRDRSDALLRALQTATNPHDYLIPDAVDDLQIDQGRYQLKGWVLDLDRCSGLDEFDPWSGDIRYPPIKPAKFVMEALPIITDLDSRVWIREDNGQNVIWCEIWGRHPSKQDENGVEEGRRLIVDSGYLTALLQRADRDLIIKVAVERKILRSRYEHNKETKLGYVPSDTRIYLFKSDGRICTV
ncbi:MAG: hypothetical protein HGA87_02950 [Desulfobulbaceae bacterium]|nr:hypothetical protein [Desulfobulbaceae bacterium]